MARSAIRRNPDGTFKTPEEITQILDSISEQDILALSGDFVTVKEMAALYGLDAAVFYRRFKDTILKGYLLTRIELKNTILSNARRGDKWALDRMASSVLGWKVDELIDLEIPKEEEELSPEELTEKLRRVK